MWTASTELFPTKGHLIEKSLPSLEKTGQHQHPSLHLRATIIFWQTPTNHLMEFPIMLRSLTSEVPPDRQPHGGSVVDVDISPRGSLMAFALLARSNWLEDWTYS